MFCVWQPSCSRCSNDNRCDFSSTRQLDAAREAEFFNHPVSRIELDGCACPHRLRGLLAEDKPARRFLQQGYDPTGRWWLSTLFAAMPVVVLLGAMAIFRVKAHLAAVIGLLTALAIAIAVYHMPARLALTTTVYGAGYGLLPICWIILPVIFLYQLTVKTGRFTTLQESLANITDDGRLQLLLIAFALGAFFEGTSGFGTPVAVCGAILISLGFKPIQAAGLSLIANTAPVAFGALGIPTITLSAVTGLDVLELTKMTALILAPFCLLVDVDASLDEHNVGRYCDIVREMSSRVQFIFITHNKITMELASQLIGVTMNEPGVSRLVAVDIDEAMKLAAV